MQSTSATLSLLRATRPFVLINPRAGRGRALVHLQRIENLFDAYEIPVQCKTTDTVEELESAARAAIAQNSRVLFVIGGDGTFQALANAAYGTEVILGLLPAGSGNDFASAVGMPANPVAALEALVQGTIRRVDLLRARTADGHVRLYVGGGGIGLDSEAARYASGEYRRLPGRLRYIASALRALAAHRSLDVKMEFPGSEQPAVTAKVLLAGVLNTPTYGGGLRLAPGATLDDGLLDVVLIEDLTALEVLSLLPRLTVSGELRTNRVRRWRVQSVRLTPGRACLFHGDGEILGVAPVEIEVVPQAVQILVPNDRSS